MNIKKYVAEFFGTLVLVLFGCGTVAVTGGASGGVGSGTLGIVAVALAFGLSIVAMFYTIGNISGCHINPAVSFAMLITKKMTFIDFIGYVISQFAGAFAGMGILYFITKNSTAFNLGANGYSTLSCVELTMSGAIIVEIVLTFVFVMTVLAVTSNKKTSNIAGLVIGGALTVVHIIGIPLTGTSVNPARSLAPAVFQGGDALSQVWVFILAPLVGAAIAAILFKFVFADKADKPED